jgi:hypothetical protein
MSSTPNSEFWHLIVESFKLLLLLLLLHEDPDLESRLENESIVSETATTKQRNFLKIESKQARRRISRTEIGTYFATCTRLGGRATSSEGKLIITAKDLGSKEGSQPGKGFVSWDLELN